MLLNCEHLFCVLMVVGSFVSVTTPAMTLGTGSTVEPKTRINYFAARHTSIHNYFNQERYLYRRRISKVNRAAALPNWCQLAA